MQNVFIEVEKYVSKLLSDDLSIKERERICDEWIHEGELNRRRVEFRNFYSRRNR